MAIIWRFISIRRLTQAVIANIRHWTVGIHFAGANYVSDAPATSIGTIVTGGALRSKAAGSFAVIL